MIDEAASIEDAIALEQELLTAVLSWETCPWCAMPDSEETENVLSCRSCRLEVRLPRTQAKQWLEQNKDALRKHAQMFSTQIKLTLDYFIFRCDGSPLVSFQEGIGCVWLCTRCDDIQVTPF